MASSLFWLSDEAWGAIEPHLPKNQPGARRVDDRRVISGILHVLKVGFWLKLLDALAQADAVTKSTAIDSTYIKAQRAAFGGKGGARPRRSVVREADGQQRSTRSPMSSVVPTR